MVRQARRMQRPPPPRLPTPAVCARVVRGWDGPASGRVIDRALAHMHMLVRHYEGPRVVQGLVTRLTFGVSASTRIHPGNHVGVVTVIMLLVPAAMLPSTDRAPSEVPFRPAAAAIRVSVASPRPGGPPRFGHGSLAAATPAGISGMRVAMGCLPRRSANRWRPPRERPPPSLLLLGPFRAGLATWGWPRRGRGPSLLRCHNAPWRHQLELPRTRRGRRLGGRVSPGGSGAVRHGGRQVPVRRP